MGGGGGGGGMEVGEEGAMLHCHHQNDSSIKMGVILIFHSLWGTKSQDCVHKPQPFWREWRAKVESSWGPSAYQPNALPLGQAGS